MKLILLVAFVSGICVTISGCAVDPQTHDLEVAPAVKNNFNDTFNNQDPCSNNNRNIGVALGAIGGGLIGYLNKGVKGALVGAAAGGGVGFLVGHEMDSRRCSLYKIAQENNLKLISASITPEKLGIEQGTMSKDVNASIGLDVQVQNQSSEFIGNTAVLTPEAKKYIGQIADQYKPETIAATLDTKASPQEVQQAKDRKVLIVGHASESDDPVAAAKLSANRAKAVATVFSQHGVPTKNIYYQGAGDTLPIANNATEQGKAENQRVQIVDMPTEADIQKYTQVRAPNPANFTAAFNTKISGNANSQAGNTPPRVTQNEPKQKKQKQKHGAADTGDLAYDFGGKPIQGADQSVDLGATVEHSMFNLVSSSHADTPFFVGSCTKDHPHSSTDIRNLSTGKTLPIRDYLPGFYGASWVSGLNGNLVSLIDVKVPVDAGSPIPNSKLYIYKDYKGNVHEKPSFNQTVNVNVYRGSKSTLYRVFVNGPMKCMDLVVKNGEPQGTGHLLYNEKTALYEASGSFLKK